MGRTAILRKRERINAWLPENIMRDLESAHKATGKSKTHLLTVALALYMQLLRKEGVLV